MKKKSKVGYGCPPKHTQFQPGKSGNSKGRPKKELNSVEDELGQIIRRRLKQKVMIPLGAGKEMKVSRLELIWLLYEQSVTKGGSARDRAAYLETIMKHIKAAPVSESLKIIVEGGFPRSSARTEFDRHIDEKSLNRLRKRSVKSA